MSGAQVSGGAGRVYFIGAGPGDPELITLRGQRLIAQADVIIYTDSLVDPRVLRWAKPGAEVHGSASLALEELEALMVGAARRGLTVARVHTGDPSLYGAMLEQLHALHRAGVPYEIVPGVSAVFAAAAALGAELTVPDLCQTVILTRAAGRTPVPEREGLRSLAAHQATMALFLSATLLDKVVGELRAAGWPEDAPVAVVQRATWPDEKIVRGTLGDITARAREAGIRSHAMILAGWALDPELVARGGYRSRLYDREFAHRYRRAASKSPRAPGGRAPGTAAAEGSAAGGAVGGGPAGGGAGAGGVDEVNRVALVAITKHGAALAGRLQAAWPASDVYVAERFLGDVGPPGSGSGRRVPLAGSVGQALEELFRRYEGLVLFISLGAVVRLIAPLLRDKHTDPAVVVIDDRALHAISVLSGHLGGANDLARRAAAVLGARPVVTTASDVGGTVAVDLLGREFGWTIETPHTVTAVSAAVVNEERVAVVREAGEPNWWPPGRRLPPGICLLRDVEEAAAAFREGRIDAALIVTHRLLGAQFAELLRRAVVYRPRSLVVGVGCNRGTPREEIEAAVRQVLADAGLSEASVRNLATIDLKRDEPGLVELARERGWPLTCYAATELNRVAFPHRSETVYRFTGAYGVAEPAALLSAAAARLLVEKVARGNVTLAVAAVRFPEEATIRRAETEESQR